VLGDAVSWLSILAGGLFIVAGAVGVLRLPDLYTRMHAASLTDTMGAALILLGLMVQEGATLISVKLALIAVFLFFTSPTSSFALAHAGMTSGVRPVLDEDRTARPQGGESQP
jgi:multicomponent Na+:H+ antiporter subunit G